MCLPYKSSASRNFMIAWDRVRVATDLGLNEQAKVFRVWEDCILQYMIAWDQPWQPMEFFCQWVWCMRGSGLSLLRNLFSGQLFICLGKQRNVSPNRPIPWLLGIEHEQRMNHTRLDSNCSCLQMQEVHLAIHDCLRPSRHALTAFGLDRQGPMFWRFRTVYLPCHTRITQFLGNLCFSNVYEITDLVFALVSWFSFAFIGFFFLFLASGGQLSQGYLKLFVFDSSSCAGTVALFWSFRGVLWGFTSLFIFSLATLSNSCCAWMGACWYGCFLFR
jgi:hypothetical protein